MPQCFLMEHLTLFLKASSSSLSSTFLMYSLIYSFGFCFSLWFQEEGVCVCVCAVSLWLSLCLSLCLGGRQQETIHPIVVFLACSLSVCLSRLRLPFALTSKQTSNQPLRKNKQWAVK